MSTYPEHTQVKGNLAPTYEVLSSSVIEDKTEFTFNQAGMAHIMATLTSLYADQSLAPLREYVSNGIDSHVLAGTSRPVEVTLPSTFEPVLIIQDFGVGMSADEMRSVYTSYGLSTKQSDMDQIGNFGYGSKSALAIADQFSVVSVKNSIRTVAVISREESGIPAMNILSSGERVSVSDGVTVKIPVKDVADMFRAAREYLYTVPRDKVKVHGVEIDNIEDDVLETIDDLNVRITKRRNSASHVSDSRFKVIMGGVAYNVPPMYNLEGTARDFQNYIRWGVFNIYAEIPIASVDLTPSREDIQSNDRSNNFLRNLFVEIARYIKTSTIAEFTYASTRAEAWEIATRPVFASVNPFPLNWNGELVSPYFGVPGTMYLVNGRSRTTSVHPRHRAHPFENPSVSDTNIYVPLEGDDAEVFSRNPRKNLVDFATKKDYDSRVRFFVMTPQQFADTSPWLRETGFFEEEVSLSEVMKLAREYRSEKRKESQKNRGPAAPRTEITYPVLTLTRSVSGVLFMDRADMTSSDIPKDALVLASGEGWEIVPDAFWHGAYVTDLVITRIHEALALLGLEKKPIVYVVKGRKVSALEKRIKRTLPTFENYVKKAYTDLFKNIPEGTLRKIHSDPHSNNTVRNASQLIRMLRAANDAIEIEDPKVIDLFENTNTDIVSYAQILNPLNLFPLSHRTLGYNVRLPEDIDPMEYGFGRDDEDDPGKYIRDTYPLVDNLRDGVYDDTHVALYINSVYNHLNRKDS